METQESHPIKTKTTVSLAEECIILLGIFSEYQPQWTEDQLARLKIWSASLGVFESGHASIDYRLRDHPDVLNLVTQQLDVLRVNLKKLKSSVSEPVQCQLQERVTSGSEFFDVDGEEFVYESPTSEASFSSADFDMESKGYRETKMSEGLQIVEETIARLNALSTAIRRSGKQSRASKADLYEVIEYVDGAKVNLTQEFRKYASAIVAREIPGADHFLKERLTVSITRRRNRFLYWKRHDKTSKIYVKKVMPSGLVKELRNPQQANVVQAEDQSFNKQNRMRDERTIMTGFTATTFDAKNFHRPTESAMGSIKPTGSVRWKNREEFPKPPKIGIKESHFVCPICLILIPAKEAKGDLWIQHVTRDLKPYVCVFESCETPHTAFDTFQDWVGHMKKEQMAPEWYCVSASHPPASFDSQGLFESHMREKHPRGFIETQLPALAQRNMRHASQVFTCCPFCSYGQDEDHLTYSSTLRKQDELQRHISSHLLSLAFISLPPINAGGLSNSDSSESSRAALDSRIGQAEPMEHLQFDDISHDPNTVESPLQPTSDWDWGFVRESLGKKRPVTDEDSPDSVLSGLWKMQQKLASKQNLNSDDSVHHQREASNESSSQARLQEDSKLATMGDPGSRNETRKSTEKHDDALLSTMAEVAVPLIPRHDEVERVQRQTVEDRQKMLGPDHPETLTSLNNLAQALFYRGQYKEAEALYRQALAGREKILGQGHLDTIKSLNNLARDLVYLGQFKAAEELYRKALVQGEVTLGLEHPYVLQNIHNLGGALRKQGQHSEAEKLCRQALIGREKVLGPEHPDTLQSVNNLGGIFEKMGKYEAAEKLYRQALAAREIVLGPDDADTLQSVHNVAGALRNQGRYNEAETLYRKALAGREKTLGRNHPSTLKSLNNLALALEKQGRYVEAEQIYQQALAVREEVLGSKHPDTFQTIDNIGSVRLNQLDYTGAELLYRQALEGRKEVLGFDHPNTLQSVRNLGKAIEKLDRLEEAEAQYREALDGRVKLLGQGHPHTLQSTEDLTSLIKRKTGDNGLEKAEASLGELIVPPE